MEKILSILLGFLIFAGCSSWKNKRASSSIEEHGDAQSLVYNEFGLIHNLKEIPLDSFITNFFPFEQYKQLRSQCLENDCSSKSKARSELLRFFFETKLSFYEKNYIVRDLFYFAIKYQ